MLIWGLKLREVQMIWGLIFLCLPKIKVSLKFSGGRKRTASYSGSLKTLVVFFGDLRKLLYVSTFHPQGIEFLPPLESRK